MFDDGVETNLITFVTVTVTAASFFWNDGPAFKVMCWTVLAPRFNSSRTRRGERVQLTTHLPIANHEFVNQLSVNHEP